MSFELRVVKLGGSVLRDEASVGEACAEVRRVVGEGVRVVVVVSALGGTTDRLVREADRHRLIGVERARLLAQGEAESVELLADALDGDGLGAWRLDARGVGIVTRGEACDGEPVGFRIDRIAHALERSSVVVAPGFVGVSEEGDVSLLGRGGSDLSALILAHELRAARCRLVKDVAGMYERDPSLPGPMPRRYDVVSYEDALRIGGRVVQDKAISYAQQRFLRFEVGPLGGRVGTLVCRGPSRLQRTVERAMARPEALRGVG